MRSIPVAMTWEMFSRGRWSLIGAALAAMAMPTIVLGALHRVGAFESGDQSQITIHMVMVQISMFVFGGWIAKHAFGILPRWLGGPAIASGIHFAGNKLINLINGLTISSLPTPPLITVYRS